MSTQKTVCDTQNDFNHAFRKAVKYVEKKETPKVWVQIVLFSIMVLLVVFSLVLASKVETDDKILHYVLSIVFAPVYILAYFVSGSKVVSN